MQQSFSPLLMDRDMLKENSFGIIPLRKEENTYFVFLVKLKSGNHWGFPKGHPIDTKEDAKAVAKREFKEETNLNVVRFLSDMSFKEHYSFKRDDIEIEKQVVYFPAQVSGRASLQEDEILDGGWYEVEKALNVLTYLPSKNVCLDLIKAIKRGEICL